MAIIDRLVGEGGGEPRWRAGTWMSLIQNLRLGTELQKAHLDEPRNFIRCLVRNRKDRAYIDLA